MAEFPKFKLTVLKRMFNEDLADEYCGVNAEPCPLFKEGQEFILDEPVPPKGFCDWAWNDLHKVYLTLLNKGNFTPWMKNENTIIACCTDGLRPVVFKLEKINE